MRQHSANVLLLDAGDMFNPNHRLAELRAKTIYRAMEKMDYDAVNVADGDICLGLVFFNALTENSPIARISANLNDTKSASPAYSPYLIKTMGKLRVGIIGLTEPSFFSASQLSIEGLTAQPAVALLARYLPEVRRQADIVVLLSHLDIQGTRALLRSADIGGVDVAIVGHNHDLLQNPEVVNGTIVIQNGLRGEYLGKLTLTIGGDRRITGFVGELVHLSGEIADAPWAARMVAAYQEEDRKWLRRTQDEAEEKRRQENLKALIEERKKLLQMSPAEAIKHLPVPTKKL